MSLLPPARWLLIVVALVASALAGASATASAAPVQRGVVLQGGALRTFDPATPGTLSDPIVITGVAATESLVDIDVRPQNGRLYALGVDVVTGNGTLYAVSAETGVAAAVGAPSAVDLTVSLPNPATTGYGIDFNPTVDRLRVVAGALNFRVNPNTGAAIDGDTSTGAIDPDGDINVGGAASTVDTTAYANNSQLATATTQFTLRGASDVLQIQTPPNDGTQTAPKAVTLGGAPLDFAVGADLDIVPNQAADGVGFAVLSVGGTSGLYRIALSTGAATLVGPIGTGAAVQGFAVRAEELDGGRPAIGLLADGSGLRRFNAAAPGTAVSSPALTNVPAGSTVVGLDWRPQTGQLYGLAVNPTSDTATLLLVDPQIGATTPIGAAGQIAFVDASGNPVQLPADGYGLDFNPTVDRLRVTNADGLNFRVNPNTGAPVDGNLNATPAPGGNNTDGRANGAGTGAAATAYTNSFGQSLTPPGPTTQYALDPGNDRLLVQTPPNAGTLTSPRALTDAGVGLDLGPRAALDIPSQVAVQTSGAEATGTALASLDGTTLRAIELPSGRTASLGALPAALDGLTIGDGLRLPLVTFADPAPPATPPASPPPTTTPPPPAVSPPALAGFGRQTLVTVRLGKGRIPTAGPIPIAVRNANRFAVSVRLSSRTAGRVRTSRRGSARTIRLSTRRVTVPTGRARTVRLVLPKALRTVLRRDRRLSLRVSAVVRAPNGATRTVRATVKPRLPARAKRRT